MSKSEEAMHGITFKDKIGYAMGDMGGLLTFGLVSAFLNMFYTDVLGISAARITVLMIVARIWDAVNDPMWGSFIDSRKPTKYGRFRPYILWASLPLAEKTLTDAGFTVKKVEKSNDGTHQAGKVIASTPSAGTSAESGSEVYLQVWGAAPTTTSASTTKSSNGFGIDIPRISDIF